MALPAKKEPEEVIISTGVLPISSFRMKILRSLLVRRLARPTALPVLQSFKSRLPAWPSMAAAETSL